MCQESATLGCAYARSLTVWLSAWSALLVGCAVSRQEARFPHCSVVDDYAVLIEEPPHGPQNPQLVVQLGHSDCITSAAFSPVGPHLVTGGADRVAILWEIKTGRVIRRFTGLDDSIERVAFSKDDRYIMAKGHSGSLRCWNTATGHAVHIIGSPRIAVPPDKESADGVASSQQLRVVFQLPRLAEPIPYDDFAYHYGSYPPGPVPRWRDPLKCYRVPCDKYMLSSDSRYVIHIMGREAGSNYAALYAPTGKPESVRFRSLAPSCQSWLRSKDGPVSTVKNSLDSVRAAAFSPDDHYLFTSGDLPIGMVFETESQPLVLAPLTTLSGYAIDIRSIACSQDDRFVLVAGTGKRGTTGSAAWLWDTLRSKVTRRFDLEHDVRHVDLSPNSRHVVCSQHRTLRVFDILTGAQVYEFEPEHCRLGWVGFSPDGGFLLSHHIRSAKSFHINVWDLDTKRKVRSVTVSQALYVPNIALVPDSNQAVIPAEGGGLMVWNYKTGTRQELCNPRDGWQLRRLGCQQSPGSHRALAVWSHDRRHLIECWDVGTLTRVAQPLPCKSTVLSTALSSNGELLLAGCDDGSVHLWRVGRPKPLRVLRAHQGSVDFVMFCCNGAFLMSGSSDDTIRYWRSDTGELALTLCNFVDDTWAAFSPTGRFDVSSLESIQPLACVLPTAPFTLQPLELLMVDFFTPGLLRDTLSQRRSISEVVVRNRSHLLPRVAIAGIASMPGDRSRATVTLTVSPALDSSSGGPSHAPPGREVYDLHLLRDSRQIGRYPTATPPLPNVTDGPASGLRLWQQATAIRVPGQDDSATVRFDDVALPRLRGKAKCTFSAYAFNQDKVKSVTTRTEFCIPSGIKSNRGRAYVVGIGVSAHVHERWNLHYPADDAGDFLRLLSGTLLQTGCYSSVVSVPLLSEHSPTKGTRGVLPTKANIRTVIGLLAGTANDGLGSRSTTRALSRLGPATPDDIVVVLFSGHAYLNSTDDLLLVPYDTGFCHDFDVPYPRPSRCISASELSSWLTGVDARETVLILDTCHSAAAVVARAFRPGPFANYGLGQTAYNKGMRVLAATQSENRAWEALGLGHGVLTHALLEGLSEGAADYRPKDDKITTREWLEYGLERVARSPDKGSSFARDGAIQQPSLFDFAEPADNVVVAEKGFLSNSWTGLHADPLRPNVVLVTSADPQRPATRGIGFVLKESGDRLLIATASRVVSALSAPRKGPQRITIAFYDATAAARSAAIAPVALSLPRDLCLLSVQRPSTWRCYPQWRAPARLDKSSISALIASHRPPMLTHEELSAEVPCFWELRREHDIGGARVTFVGANGEWSIPRGFGLVADDQRCYDSHIVVTGLQAGSDSLGAPLVGMRGICGMIVEETSDTGMTRALSIEAIMEAARTWRAVWPEARRPEPDASGRHTIKPTHMARVAAIERPEGSRTSDRPRSRKPKRTEHSLQIGALVGIDQQGRCLRFDDVLLPARWPTREQAEVWSYLLTGIVGKRIPPNMSASNVALRLDARPMSVRKAPSQGGHQPPRWTASCDIRLDLLAKRFPPNEGINRDSVYIGGRPIPLRLLVEPVPNAP